MEKEKTLELNKRNEFIRDFNLLILSYNERLDKLGLFNEENLAEILRNIIYNLEKTFSIYQENSFYSSISSQAIIELFKDLLKSTINKMDAAYERQNSSMLYYFIHMFIDEKWYIDYEKMCYSFKCLFSLSDYIEPIIMKFYEYIKENNLNEEELQDLLITFKSELIILCDGEDISHKVDKCLVKLKV